MNAELNICVSPVQQADRSWVKAVLVEHWMDTRIALRGQLMDISGYPGFYARFNGKQAGLLLYREYRKTLEILAINSLIEGKGVGRAMIRSLMDETRNQGLNRILVITMNSNLKALNFYKACGFSVVRIYENSVQQLRKLKPAIPLIDENGLPVKDEVELELNVPFH